MKVCTWKEDDNGWAWAGCVNDAFPCGRIIGQADEGWGTASEPKWNYCPYCGEKIKVEEYEDEDDE